MGHFIIIHNTRNPEKLTVRVSSHPFKLRRRDSIILQIPNANRSGSVSAGSLQTYPGKTGKRSLDFAALIKGLSYRFFRSLFAWYLS